MKRLTWQNYDMCQFCGEGACCEHYCDNTFPVCGDKEIYDRLAAIEDILGDEYDLDRLSVMVNQCMTMREEVAQRFALTAKMPLDRLKEIAEAERDGRCVVLPCEPGHEISYKSGIGLRCNAVIDEYTPANIFITAKTEIPNAEPLIQTFSILEVEDALKARERDEQ